MISHRHFANALHQVRGAWIHAASMAGGGATNGYHGSLWIWGQSVGWIWWWEVRVRILFLRAKTIMLIYHHDTTIELLILMMICRSMVYRSYVWIFMIDWRVFSYYLMCSSGHNWDSSPWWQPGEITPTSRRSLLLTNLEVGCSQHLLAKSTSRQPSVWWPPTGIRLQQLATLAASNS